MFVGRSSQFGYQKKNSERSSFLAFLWEVSSSTSAVEASCFLLFELWQSWRNDHMPCTCSTVSEINPSSLSFALGVDLISYLGACDCTTSFLFLCLSWHEIRTLDSPQVEYHEVFDALLFSPLLECILPIAYQIWATWFDHLVSLDERLPRWWETI